eukprot:scaffold20356_cov125-Isochrysis_galbana.AAC.7
MSLAQAGAGASLWSVVAIAMEEGEIAYMCACARIAYIMQFNHEHIIIYMAGVADPHSSDKLKLNAE